ncbi:MAG: sigma-70 family RNA polymerase sigma factor [Bacillota bacterium]|nr:sigma-70 family RNA polymerase sigma factor [Bacillota bacterium]
MNAVMKKTARDAISPAELPEEVLIRRAAEGDIVAFEYLLAAHQRRIYNIGLRMLGNAEDAADMTQEVLLKIYRSLPSFRGDAAFSTWVYRISVNTCRDMLRSAYKRRERIFSDFSSADDDDREIDVADYSALPDAQMLDREDDRYLLELINGLTPKYRIVMVLREISGLGYAEIAESAGISIGTVKSRINRARAVMRKRLLADAESYPQAQRLIDEGGAK